MSTLLKDATQAAQAASSQPSQSSQAATPPLMALPLPRKTIRDEVFSLPEGEIRLTWPAPLSVDSYGEIKQWLELLKIKMQRTLPEGGRT